MKKMFVISDKEYLFEPPLRGEVFTHRDDDGVYRHFPAKAMFDFAEKHHKELPLVICRRTVEIGEKGYIHIKTNMGIEQARLDRLCEPYLSQPIVGIQWGDLEPGFTVIDGNHRTVKLWEAGIKKVELYLFRRVLWEEMLIDIDPRIYVEKLLGGDSGILKYEKTNAGK